MTLNTLFVNFYCVSNLHMDVHCKTYILYQEIDKVHLMSKSTKHDSKKYLFIEDSMIDEMSNTCKILNSPNKYAGNPILRPSQPWEYNVGFLGTVLKDETSGLIKTWYQNWIDDNYRVGYATSLNGVHWEKPDCGIYQVRNKPTNQVMASGCTPNVIYEPEDPDPSKDIKCFFGIMTCGKHRKPRQVQ